MNGACLLSAKEAGLRGADRASYIERVDILLEGDAFAVLERPDMNSLQVYLAVGLVECAFISPQRNDAATAIDQVVHRNPESVPFADTARKNTRGNGVRTAMGIVVCVGKIFRFVPNNVGAHPSEHAGHVAGTKYVVKTLDQGNVFRR